jgi:nucleotide-binding universal stress UspA family protein
MYEKVLVALDGSKLSEGILSYARFIAAKLKVPVELLHVIDIEAPRAASADQQIRHENVIAAEQKNSMDYLKKVAASFADAGATKCAVKIGKPAEVIVDRAATDARMLIAMTTHGRSGMNRWLLGSIADKVLHAAANPLLLVRGADESEKLAVPPVKKIMVALDGSPLAEMVLPNASELAAKMGLGVVLTRVFGVPTPSFAEDYGTYVEELWEQVETETQEYLDEKAKQLQRQGLTDVTVKSVAGFASEKLIELAHESGETLVAMCTHGRSGVNRWVLGSVTDRVVRHLGGPVLIIRAPSTAATQ